MEMKHIDRLFRLLNNWKIGERLKLTPELHWTITAAYTDLKLSKDRLKPKHIRALLNHCMCGTKEQRDAVEAELAQIEAAHE